jgi:hypothetical protein
MRRGFISPLMFRPFWRRSAIIALIYHFYGRNSRFFLKGVGSIGEAGKEITSAESGHNKSGFKGGESSVSAGVIFRLWTCQAKRMRGWKTPAS